MSQASGRRRGARHAKERGRAGDTPLLARARPRPRWCRGGRIIPPRREARWPRRRRPAREAGRVPAGVDERHPGRSRNPSSSAVHRPRGRRYNNFRTATTGHRAGLCVGRGVAPIVQTRGGASLTTRRVRAWLVRRPRPGAFIRHTRRGLRWAWPTGGRVTRPTRFKYTVLPAA